MAIRVFLQFGGALLDKPNGPFETVEAEYKHSPAPRSGNTVSGYGARIPTGIMVRHAGKWRRVYAIQYGNAPSFYIGKSNDREAIVNIHDMD